MMNTKLRYDEEAKIYEQTSRQVTPFYDLALKKLIKYIPKNTESFIDVCCGTGIMTEVVTKTFPNAQILGIDFSSGMLSFAKKKFKGNKKIKFLEADMLDYEKLKNITKVDVIISSYGIHNIKSKELKVEALKNIYEMLNEGGVFVNLDYIQGKNYEQEEKFKAFQRKHLRKSFNEKETQEWVDLLAQEDEPETIKNNIKLLEKAGFKSNRFVWQKKFLAISVSKK